MVCENSFLKLPNGKAEDLNNTCYHFSMNSILI